VKEQEQKNIRAKERGSWREANTHLSSPSTTPKPMCSTRVTLGSYHPAAATTAKHVFRCIACRGVNVIIKLIAIINTAAFIKLNQLIKQEYPGFCNIQKVCWFHIKLPLLLMHKNGFIYKDSVVLGRQKVWRNIRAWIKCWEIYIWLGSWGATSRKY